MSYSSGTVTTYRLTHEEEEIKDCGFLLKWGYYINQITSEVERGSNLLEKATSEVEKGSSLLEKGSGLLEKGSGLLEKGSSLLEKGSSEVERKELLNSFWLK